VTEVLDSRFRENDNLYDSWNKFQEHF